MKKLFATMAVLLSAWATMTAQVTPMILGDSHAMMRLEQGGAKYVLLPVQEKEENAHIAVLDGQNEMVKRLNVRLAVDKVDYLVPLEIGKGRLLDITFNGKTETQYFTLTDVLRIGRNSKECEIVLKSDPTVSRTHCELLLKGGQVYVHNLSHSEAGTILNGMRIAAGGGSATGEDEATVNIADFKGDEEEALVQSGDELTLGRHTVRITFVQ